MNPKTLRNVITAIRASTPKAINFHQKDGTLTVFSLGHGYVAASLPNDGPDFSVQIDRTKALMAALHTPGAEALVADGVTLVVSGAGWRVGIPCSKSEDAPKVPPPMVLLPDSLLVPAVAMPADVNRYGLSVLHIEEHRAVCTDGNRLTYSDTTVTLAPADIPAWMLRGGKGTVAYADTGDAIWTERQGIVRQQRRVEVEFPNYREVLPKRHAWAIRGDRDHLLSALAAVLPIANQTRQPTPITVSAVAGVLLVSASVVDVGVAHAKAAVSIEGEPPLFGISARFLSDAIRIQPAGPVEIAGGRPLEPMRVMGGGDCISVVMPQRLS